MLKNKILEFLKSYSYPVKEKKIYKEFKSYSVREIGKALKNLEDSGEIFKIRKGLYVSTKNREYVVGKLSVFRAGFGFVDPIEGGNGIFIAPRNIRYALNGDIVKCYIFNNKKKTEGKIEQIFERGNNKLVGIIIKKRKDLLFSPIDKRVNYNFRLDVTDRVKVKEGDYTVAKIEFNQDPNKRPKIKIVENLGKEAPGMDIELILRKYNIITNFSKEELKEADAISEVIPEKEIEKRIDLRGQLCFTIDGDDAKDFDDAVAIQKLKDNRYRLFVHIADVSYYVRTGTKLDNSAYKRGTSVYFPGRCIPMLPEKISNGVCSLNPYQDRLTVSCEMVVNSEGEVEEYKIYKSIINSKARLTYRTVQNIFDGIEEPKRDFPYLINALYEMKELAEILIKKRRERGSIDFDMDDPDVILDSRGMPIEITVSERFFSHRLIEEFMILANETVATFMLNSGVPSIYRVHDTPKQDKVEEFLRFLKFIGVDIDIKSITPKLFQNVLLKIEGKPEENLVHYLMLRTMSLAKYSPINTGHFGLASKCYTHFTSPIRRYADLTLHRLLKLVLDNKFNSKAIVYWKERLNNIANDVTELSANADNVEREIIAVKQLQFISKLIGDIFEGIITQLNNKEISIELIDSLIRGFIPVNDDDNYIFDQKNFSLIDNKKKSSLQIGNRVIVRLLDVNIDEMRAKFKLIRKVKEIKYMR